MKIWGYARISTTDVGEDNINGKNKNGKQNIMRQVDELKRMGVEEVVLEIESGLKEDRKELQRLLNSVQEGDTIISLEVSRITRSTKQLCLILELAQAKKLKLIFGSFIVDCSKDLVDPMTLGMLKMMSVFSELEAQLIRARVCSGLEHAKSRGVKLGRKPTCYENIPNIFFHYLPKYQNNEINKSEYSRLTKLSMPSIYKYLEIVQKWS